MALTMVTVAMAPLSIPQLAMMEGWTAIKKASVMKEVAPATSSVGPWFHVLLNEKKESKASFS